MGVKTSPQRGRYLNAAWQELSEKRAYKYREEVVDLYDAGINWVDQQVSRLVDGLRTRSQWDRSVFALTADHGEEFLDHGGRFHHSSRVFQELLRVPLLLRLPGIISKPFSAAPFSHLHLGPTLLDAVGVEAPPEFEGRSVPGVGETAEWAVSESVGRCTNPMEADKRLFGRVLAVQDRRYKLVVDFDGKSEQFFDLENDPREAWPLAADAEKATRARLLRLVAQHLARPAQGASRERAMRARVREVGLEWKHSKMKSRPLAS
jgi:arylsulfatase A-like enzyme